MVSIANGMTEVVVIPLSTKFIGTVKRRLKFKGFEAILVPTYHPQILAVKFL
jgi:hypothetical protein